MYVANLRSYHKTVEIAANPRVELVYLDDQHDQVRITGVAEVLTDRLVLEEIWADNPLLRQYLGTIDNPALIVYRIRPDRVRYMKESALSTTKCGSASDPGHARGGHEATAGRRGSDSARPL